jgi:hypothetical protein
MLAIIKLSVNTSGGTRVYWDLINENIVTNDPLNFSLYASQDFNNWNLITTVTNTFFATDPNEYKLGSFDFLWYKVKLTYGTKSLESAPVSIQQSFGNFIKFRLWNEISRKYRLYGQHIALRGVIYRRKRFGNPCPLDADPLAKMPQRALCPQCFGTGIDGGYFVGDQVAYFFHQPVDTSELITEIGRVSPQKMQGLLYSDIPYAPNDLFRNLETGDIWEIEFIKQFGMASALLPVNIVACSEKPRNHILYKLPVPNI